jgi:hypothetical protein
MTVLPHCIRHVAVCLLQPASLVWLLLPQVLRMNLTTFMRTCHLHQQQQHQQQAEAMALPLGIGILMVPAHNQALRMMMKMTQTRWQPRMQ